MKRIILILLISLCLVGCIGLTGNNTYSMRFVAGGEVFTTSEYAKCKTYGVSGLIRVECYYRGSSILDTPDHQYSVVEFWENK